MAYAQIVLILILGSVLIGAATTQKSNILQTLCDPNKDSSCDTTECREVCGCDRIYIFDEEKAECILNFEYLKELTASKNYISSENDMVLEDEIATKIRESVEKVFRGIIASAIFFIICCSICVMSVLIFCCHIRRSDNKLKNELKALAKKMKIDVRKKTNIASPSKPHDPVGNSCNVVVTDANVMCV